MTEPPDPKLVEVLRGTRALLLDFDGPVCSIFAGYPAPIIAAQLRNLAAEWLGSIPTQLIGVDDPIQVLRLAADLGLPALTTKLATALRDAEVTATETATPTPGLPDVLAAARNTGRQIAIVSNNSTEAVHAYLDRHRLAGHINRISARHADMDLHLLKPNPHLLAQVLVALDVEPQEAALVGDSVFDIKAASAAGVAIVGLANKLGKNRKLAEAGANVVVDRMQVVADGLRLARSSY